MTVLNGKNPVKFADHIPTTNTLKKGQIAYDTNGDIYTSTAENYGANGVINKLTNCKCGSTPSTTTYLFGNIEYIEEIPIFDDGIYKTSQEYLPNTLELYVSGLRQIRDIDYVENADNKSFEISEALNENIQLFVRYAVVTKSQIIIEEVPIGIQASTNKIFQTTREYLPNTLELYISGLRQMRNTDYTEIGKNTFEINEAPNNVQLFTKYTHLGA